MLVIVSDLHLTDGTTGATIGASAFEDFRERLRQLAVDASWRDNRKAYREAILEKLNYKELEQLRPVFDDKAWQALTNTNEAMGYPSPNNLSGIISDSQWKDLGEFLKARGHELPPEKVYRPIKSYDLVLLGDIFDHIRSTLWEHGGIRPWDDPYSPTFVDKVDEITEAILDNNQKVFAILKSLSEGAVRIPRARDDELDGRIRVPACIHYVVGNHDWFFHLKKPEFFSNPRGITYDTIREKVIDALGLCHAPDQPFPHNPPKDGHLELRMAFYKHQVVARHGDIFDPFNFDNREDTRDVASLGDAIVIDLLNPFPGRVRGRLGNDLNADFLDGLDEIANVRPSLLAPVWIAGLLDQYQVSKEHRREVKRIWDELADEFLAIPYVKGFDKVFLPWDRYDQMQTLFRFADWVSFSQVAKIAQFVRKVTKGSHLSYSENAAKEPWLDEKWHTRDVQRFGLPASYAGDTKAHYVVYGHTHHQEVIPIRRIETPEGNLGMMFFNSGTWKPVHEQTLQISEGAGFVAFNVMTYVAFFQEDERSGRPFETWSGTLGQRF